MTSWLTPPQLYRQAPKIECMEPMEVNAGRFYCRPLRRDSRVDDAPATARVLTSESANTSIEEAAAFLANATTDWEHETAYRFAVAEQTNVEMLALATVTPKGSDQADITVEPVGDTARVLPNDDQMLEKVTVADGVAAAEDALRRWSSEFLGKEAS